MTKISKSTSIETQLSRFDNPLELPPEAFEMLGNHIEEALLASSRDKMEVLAKALRASLRAAVAKVPKAAAKALRGPSVAEPAVYGAYALGKLSFASLVTTQAIARLAGSDFAAALRSEEYFPIMRALLDSGELTGTELAQTAGCRPETVSRKLRDLRAMGAVEFRREGTRLRNFLTPLARAALEIERSSRLGIHRPPAAVQARLEQKEGELAPFMREATTFALELDEAIR